jgi:lipoprotein signal peptidase
VLVPLVVGLSADIWTKYEAVDRLLIEKYPGLGGVEEIDSEEYAAIPGLLHFRYHENRGAVFGIGQGARTLFIFVSVLALGLLTYLFARSGRQRLYQVLLGMLIAGVLGNLYDRATYGYVRDMIYAFPDKRWSDLWQALPDAQVFPWIFNIADSLLCVGVAGMFVFTMLRREDPMTSQLPDRDQAVKDAPAAASDSTRA